LISLERGLLLSLSLSRAREEYKERDRARETKIVVLFGQKLRATAKSETRRVKKNISRTPRLTDCCIGFHSLENN